MRTLRSIDLKIRKPSLALPVAVLAAVWAGAFAGAGTTQAALHMWVIEEVYSDAAGDAQYVQLHQTPPMDFEHFFAGAELTSDGNTFTFPGNLPGSDTANRRVLLGTADFAALDGSVDPDFTLPAGFFDPAGDTITFQGGGFGVISQFSFGPGDLPSDGLHARHYLDGNVLNAPTNWDGDTGFVPEPATATLMLAAGALAMLRRSRGHDRR